MQHRAPQVQPSPEPARSRHTQPSSFPIEPGYGYGRIVARFLGNVMVDYMDQGKIATEACSLANVPSHLAMRIKVGTAILGHRHPTAGYEDYGDTTFTITKLFSPEEEAILRHHGATFPEVPPELRPEGYYG